jgi:metal-dependent amidase/aminoacylase/carboxypeptidase family protein
MSTFKLQLPSQEDERQMSIWRRHIHANPELSFEEIETREYVVAQLLDMGMEEGSIRRLAKTGLVVRIGPVSGVAVALRADMDALPIQEDTGLPFASTKGACVWRDYGVDHFCHCPFLQLESITHAHTMDMLRVCCVWRKLYTPIATI